MLTKFDSVKALKTLIKLAAVALTSPATVGVASNLYPDDPILRVVVSVAALILVEGCLLLGWEMLSGKPSTVDGKTNFVDGQIVVDYAIPSAVVGQPRQGHPDRHGA